MKFRGTYENNSMLQGFVLTVFQYDGESFSFENHLGTVSLPIANVRRKPVVEFIKKGIQS